jgi:hypothetical protein
MTHPATEREAMLDLEAMRDEELVPELVAALHEGGALGPVIQHPLVVDIFPINGLANRHLAYKKQAVQQAYEDGDYQQAMWLHERMFRLDFVHRHWLDGKLDKELLGELLAAAYTDNEYPVNNTPGGVYALRSMFKDAEYLTDAPGIDLPGENITAWRGCEPEYKLGLSWTRDREQAAWFAERWDKGGEVYETSVHPDAIMGYFLDRGEAEVVVDPLMLGDLRQVS